MALFQKIAFVASPTGHAREAAAALMRRYDHVPPEEADVVVALGGDGLMLQVLHRFMDNPKPIYGMNRGTVGFLMNEFRDDDLLEHLETAHRSVIHPLVMDVLDTEGRSHRARAINEVYLLRQTHQTAKLKIAVDGNVRLDLLIADGVLVATAAGSTTTGASTLSRSAMRIWVVRVGTVGSTRPLGASQSSIVKVSDRRSAQSITTNAVLPVVWRGHTPSQVHV